MLNIMANKNIFSYAKNGKRKIGHSKFDMGFEHITSGNFGSLQPVGVFETLPDDFWDISQNTVTLLKPLTAPAMTRINQNFYGAYVRNQQIWSHWNDFISNGTAYGDVYGNNVTNQSLENAWEVPNIPTPYLQVISKIGNGYAAPVHHFHFVLERKTATTSDELISQNNFGLLPDFMKYLFYVIDFANLDKSVGVKRLTDALAIAVAVSDHPDIANSSFASGNLARIAHNISKSKFYDVAFDLFADLNNTTYASGKNMMLFDLYVYCSESQWLSFSDFIYSHSSSDASVETHIGTNNTQHISVNDSTYSTDSKVFFRFFCDDISSDPSVSLSPFITERSVYPNFRSEVTKSIDFHPRIIDSSVKKCVFPSTFEQFNYSYDSFHNPIFGFRLIMLFQPPISGSNITTRFCSYNMTQGVFEPDDEMFWVSRNFLESNSGPDAHEVFDSLVDSISSRINIAGACVHPSNWFESFDSFGTFDNHLNIKENTSFNGMLLATGFGRMRAVYDPTLPPVMFFTSDMYFKSSSYPTTLGFDNISHFVYLCQNASKLFDSMNIKVDPLSARPFYHYRYERTNALPFMAYSKIWNDNFRNPVVSSPELDYKSVNGSILIDEDFINYFIYNQDYKQPAIIPPYFNRPYTEIDKNGWVIELTAMPRNSIGAQYHTHLPVTSLLDVLTLLVGYDFTRWFTELEFAQLSLENYYLPQYYNGLCHLKYQNFNKDYFTSAMLDPMSGANQVEVGSTINELRENEAKQHWWERTAMYRSIKNFFQGTYGITPIELPEDSRITGTDHTDIQIGEVIQTSSSTPESPQGSRTGLGGAHGKGSLCHGHANEHGWIIVLMSHTVESQYLQCYDKMWDVKDSFLDYPTVDFAGIGNESILQKEVNYSTVPTIPFHFREGSNAYSYDIVSFMRDSSKSFDGMSSPSRVDNVQYKVGGRDYRVNFNIAQAAGTSLNNVFGFIPRYSSYKFKFDQVSGQFRHELSFWHTFKRYFAQPILCHEFVNWELAADDEELNRIFAVTEDAYDDKFCIDCFINASVDRALPFVCVPSSK